MMKQIQFDLQFQANENHHNPSVFSHTESVIFQSDQDEEYVPSTFQTVKKEGSRKHRKNNTEFSESTDSAESPKKKPRKKPTSEVKCGCGLDYVAYPALYTHIKRKHKGVPPPGTKYGDENEKASEKTKNNKVGRPPVFRENAGAPEKKIQEENERFTAHNDLYVALGTMGQENQDQEKLGRGKKNGNLVYDEELQAIDNNPIDKYYDPYRNSQVHEIIRMMRLRLPTIQELLDSDRLDCEDELKDLIDRTDKSFVGALGAFVAWISEKLRVKFYREFCVFVDVLNYSCGSFAYFYQQAENGWSDLLRMMNERLTAYNAASLRGDFYAIPVLLSFERNQLQLNIQHAKILLDKLYMIAKTNHL